MEVEEVSVLLDEKYIGWKEITIYKREKRKGDLRPIHQYYEDPNGKTYRKLPLITTS
jgi:hypothetical protein